MTVNHKRSLCEKRPVMPIHKLPFPLLPIMSNKSESGHWHRSTDAKVEVGGSHDALNVSSLEDDSTRKTFRNQFLYGNALQIIANASTPETLQKKKQRYFKIAYLSQIIILLYKIIIFLYHHSRNAFFFPNYPSFMFFFPP